MTHIIFLITTFCLIVTATESHDKRRVVCFGCSSGIGEAIGASFVQQGASVVFNSRTQAKVEAAAAKALASGKGKALAVGGDCEKEADVKSVIEKANKFMGGIDCIIWAPTGASVGWAESTFETQFNAGFDNQLVMNVKALLWAVRYSLDELVKSNNPTIITISSIAGASPIEGLLLYSIAKAAQEMAVKGLALELAQYGIRAYAIEPATIDTPIFDSFFDAKAKSEYLGKSKARHPLKRNGQSQEVAELALFLASERSSFMTGTVIPVDGGSSLLNSHTDSFSTELIGARPDRRHQKTKADL